MAEKTPEEVLKEFDAWVSADDESAYIDIDELAEALRDALKQRDDFTELQKSSGMGADMPCNRCRNVFKNWHNFRAKLEIAVEALKGCYATASEFPGCFEETITREALDKIGEIK